PKRKGSVHAVATESFGSPVLAPTAASVRLAPARKPKQPLPPSAKFEANTDFQMRIPAIIGEVRFRGTIPVDGIVCGIPGANGGQLQVRQRGRAFCAEPELDGDMSFRDMLRVNGYIAGSL